MKFLKKNLVNVLMCLFEILVGVLLLVDPVTFTSGIIMAVGFVIVAAGIVCVIKYFRTEAKIAAKEQLLVKGLASLVCGFFCILNSHWFLVTFPLMTIVFGVAILLTGLGKIQITVDMIRLGGKKWGWGLLSAAITISCACIILCSPFSSTAVLWVFTGISLIVEAVFDILAMFFSNRKPKEEAKKEPVSDDVNANDNSGKQNGN